MDNYYRYYMPCFYYGINKLKYLDKKNIYCNESNEYGYLDVNVIRYVLKEPVKNALIRVSKLTVTGSYKEIGLGKFITTQNTDATDKVPAIKLPVLKNKNEMYILSVIADNYHSAYVFDVPIYPNITTMYNIYLRGLSFEGEPDYEFILQPQIPGHY